MSALEIRDIRKNYGAVETLKGIDIALESGEFLVLLGSSGCGKSTLLNIIAGLAEATSGDVLIGGRSVLGVHPKNRDIAMVFQSYALYPNLTVHRNIGFGLEMRKVPVAERDKAVREAARLLQIEPLLDRKPGQLSGGQRQRVAIGRALVRKPQVFLFDEPLSNLDAKLRLEMRTELKRLHQMLQTTVVYVTHDQIEAMTLASRIAVMRDGRIEQLGTPEEIYNHPATLYVAGFVGAPSMNMLQAEIQDGKLAIVGANTRLALPPRYAKLSGDDAPVVVGIRPEALRLGPGSGAELSLPVEVDVVELTGPEQVTTARIGAQRLTATLPPQVRVAKGQRCTFIFDEDALRLFDPATGNAL
ncbi:MULTISPECIES: sn-glycerol-3-phosphate ABC transporter ATP-binding protein UgpC [unclassified Mesorhizobium]|uniref:ABC transporter ATP-binding protein n=1 Tax=unclassified Mesorhizobium TaxID=325217 RepID=UPI000BB0C063|nr:MULTISPECIES: sn-glycerol-3-phosphate ABC transporter ATP-binding protein UgpC [unclassified Mesorhizobium]TGT56697.1 sn-glycerol-3-phosphate ABC transporter ATP-binding protein UgpC [Mesorhizobium sp. M00.F.Ca.ET.170.01.1.1]AZO11748.1 sn-glycerol-3-phosphate ABC transporter ATP-binding protein UgpC [Mesorhizobium sp. M3A.F.Ca.ET.080.04.2.1]PBB86639.1 sugar ABC transporter ATP-binding protein [Mesorhizobium sp. WSM3876]RWB72617.1 MAG: sn-glycerol-3-phosphate ABC transporter ATP-binding prote